VHLLNDSRPRQEDLCLARMKIANLWYTQIAIITSITRHVSGRNESPELLHLNMVQRQTTEKDQANMFCGISRLQTPLAVGSCCVPRCGCYPGRFRPCSKSRVYVSKQTKYKVNSLKVRCRKEHGKRAAFTCKTIISARCP
jgi:hypothetical protein